MFCNFAFMLVANILVFSDFCTNLIFLIISFGLSALFIAGISSSGGMSM